MKVQYEIKVDRDARPPERNPGTIPRWLDVTDQLVDLARNGGVMTIAVPRSMVQKEVRSLRNAISRWRKKTGNHHRFHLHIDAKGNGIKLWPFSADEMTEEYDDD